jgi:hypothetical protein
MAPVGGWGTGELGNLGCFSTLCDRFGMSLPVGDAYCDNWGVNWGWFSIWLYSCVGLGWIYPSLCQLVMSVTPLRGNSIFGDVWDGERVRWW